MPSFRHLGVNPGANIKSNPHRCHPIVVAFVCELTEETINMPLGCLQGGEWSDLEIASESDALRFKSSNEIRRCDHLPADNVYRGTSLIRKRLPLGPYRMPMTTALWWC